MIIGTEISSVYIMMYFTLEIYLIRIRLKFSAKSNAMNNLFSKKIIISILVDTENLMSVRCVAEGTSMPAVTKGVGGPCPMAQCPQTPLHQRPDPGGGARGGPSTCRPSNKEPGGL